MSPVTAIPNVLVSTNVGLSPHELQAIVTTNLTLENVALNFCQRAWSQTAAPGMSMKRMQWKILHFAELSSQWLYAMLRLRQNVFVVEQQCAYQDIDDLDQSATHILCMREASLLAYQRCLPPGLSYPESSLGRIVVCPTMRGQQLGRELVRRGVAHNLALWPDSGIRINAQAHLQPFYSSLGFIGEGSEYLLDNIPHRQMCYQIVSE
jgi:ElaA protein